MSMLHFACDFAKEAMQVAYAGTGIWLSDGATNILPVPVHHAGPGGHPLTSVQIEDNRRAVHQAWKLHFEHIHHSLVNGFYQGWDLHPAQLPSRYAAVYAFFLDGLGPASERPSQLDLWDDRPAPGEPFLFVGTAPPGASFRARFTAEGEGRTLRTPIVQAGERLRDLDVTPFSRFVEDAPGR